jgi:hypothetical protein
MSVTQYTDRYMSGESALRDKKGRTSKVMRHMAYIGVKIGIRGPSLKLKLGFGPHNMFDSTVTYIIGVLVVATEATRQRSCSVCDGNSKCQAAQ